MTGTTRADFLVRGALATAAAWGASAAGSLTSRALAKAGDIGVLDFAVRLEEVQSAFYHRARRVPLTPAVSDLAARFAEHEQEHADALLSLLAKQGGATPRTPSTAFPPADEKAFLTLAQTLEETTVRVYEGLTPLLVSRELVAAFASITQVEARHDAAVRHALGERPAPVSFDTPTSRSAAFDAIAPLIRE